MKIGLVLSSTPAYSETFFISKIKGLQLKGHEVVLFVQQHQTDFKLCTVKKSNKVYRNPVIQGLVSIVAFFKLVTSIKSVKKFIQLEKSHQTSVPQLLKKIYLNAHILKGKVDWLHFGFATMALEKEFLSKSIGAKMAVSFRGFDIAIYPLKYPNCYDLLWQEVDKVHTISNDLLTKAYALGLQKETPFEKITPAIDIAVFNDTRTTVNIEGNIKFLTVARLHWIKGLDIAINAIKLLKDKGLNVEYNVIGSGLQKDIERYLFQIYELGLKREITLLGSLSHAETLEQLKDATIYEQPSLNEGFDNAVLEAQAYGLLTIASNVGGLAENVVDRETGWLVSPRNAVKLAGKIIEVQELPLKEKKRVILNSTNRINSQFCLTM